MRASKGCEERRRAEGVLGLYINLLTLEDGLNCGTIKLTDNNYLNPEAIW